MPLDTKQLAIKIAVLSFFALSITGLCLGISPYVICVRAIGGAIIMYVGSTIAIKIINVVLFDVIINRILNHQDEQKNEQQS